jgi:D-alanyl-D-alanine carboxypeptidase (penicillin-binding protein 5/6)
VLGAEKVTKATGGSDVQSFSETTRMFEWGFENFTYQTVLTPTDMLASMPVTLSEIESVALHCTDDVVVLLPKVLSAEDLTRTIRFRSKSVEAPVAAGDQLAEVELSYNGTTYATVPLVALADVPASRSLVIKAQIRAFFDRTLVKVICGAVLALAVFLVVWKLTIGRQRYRYGKNVRRQKNYRGRNRL